MAFFTKSQPLLPRWISRCWSTPTWPFSWWDLTWTPPRSPRWAIFPPWSEVGDYRRVYKYRHIDINLPTRYQMLPKFKAGSWELRSLKMGSWKLEVALGALGVLPTAGARKSGRWTVVLMGCGLCLWWGCIPTNGPVFAALVLFGYFRRQFPRMISSLTDLVKFLKSLSINEIDCGDFTWFQISPFIFPLFLGFVTRWTSICQHLWLIDPKIWGWADETPCWRGCNHILFKQAFVQKKG